jgi:hypothetical protein
MEGVSRLSDDCSLVTSPHGKEEAVRQRYVPDVRVAGSGKLSRIAGIEAHFVGEVVIEAEISLLGIGRGQTIARAWAIAESLLHPENRL